MPKGKYDRSKKKVVKKEKEEKVVKKKAKEQEIEESETKKKEEKPEDTSQNEEDKPVESEEIKPSNEIPPPEKNGEAEDEKVCANCDPTCEGKGATRWHYGSKDKWCNKCTCMALKQ